MEQETLETSLVRIRKLDGEVVGAGFLVGACQVLTCAHVIAQALDLPETLADPPLASIVLDFPLLAPRLRLAARVMCWHPITPEGSGDIAGLELLGDPPEGATPVHFSPANDVWGHDFRAFGFPIGQDDGVWATGRLLGRQATHWLLLEDVKTEGFAVIPGFSGGPVWDTQLQGVIGMIVAASGRAETKAAFVIPFEVLAAAWPCLQPSEHQETIPFRVLVILFSLLIRQFHSAEDSVGVPVFAWSPRRRKPKMFHRKIVTVALVAMIAFIGLFVRSNVAFAAPSGPSYGVQEAVINDSEAVVAMAFCTLTMEDTVVPNDTAKIHCLVSNISGVVRRLLVRWWANDIQQQPQHPAMPVAPNASIDFDSRVKAFPESIKTISFDLCDFNISQCSSSGKKAAWVIT